MNPAPKDGFVQSASDGSNCRYCHRRPGGVTHPGVTGHSLFWWPELVMAFSTADLALCPCGLGWVTQINPPPMEQHTPSLLSCGHLVSKRSWCRSVPARGGSALLLPCSSNSRVRQACRGETDPCPWKQPSQTHTQQKGERISRKWWDVRKALKQNCCICEKDTSSTLFLHESDL